MEENYMDSTQRLFMDLSHLIFQKSYNVMQEQGIYPGQIPFFKILSEQDGLSQREIAEALRISPPSVTVSIKRMEKNGLVERKPDEKDQRITRIYLTEKGKQLDIQVKQALKKMEDELLEGFQESEVCLLRRFFQHMIENVQKTMPKGAGMDEFPVMCNKSGLKGD